MWMMGCGDARDQLENIPDHSFSGRPKLRTLVPRLQNGVPVSMNNIHHDFLTLNHRDHSLVVSEQNRRDDHLVSNATQVVVSSRWNPTPEQLQNLEALYRRGTRTPSADQIQKITAQLRRYGKIEGKNVFYWFQNHKARERQKRRRNLEAATSSENDAFNNKLPASNSNDPDKKGSELEGEETAKGGSSPTKSSRDAEKGSRKVSAEVIETECKTDGWVQLDDQQTRATFVQRNAATYNNWHQIIHLSSSSAAADGGGVAEAKTLQLFPCESDRGGCGSEEKDEDQKLLLSEAVAINASAPFQFFEFLPLKNGF